MAWLDMLTLSLGGTDFNEFDWIAQAANDNYSIGGHPADQDDFDPAEPIDGFEDDMTLDTFERMMRDSGFPLRY